MSAVVYGRQGKTRTYLRVAILLPLLCLLLSYDIPAAEPQTKTSDSLRVVLIGTGTPIPSSRQFGPSILVEGGGNSYVVDCGRGCGIRLAQYYGIRNYHRASTVLLTHFHSDHVVGLPEVYLNGWLQQRATPFRLIGPKGVGNMTDGLKRAFQEDLRIRTYEAGVFQSSLAGGDIESMEIAGDGVILEEDGMTVTAFEVDHGHANPAFGFRFDYDGRSVVISGDTGPSENLVKNSEGVDVVVHEVMSPGLIRKIETHYPRMPIEFVTAIHTTPQQAGELFSVIQPKLAVYYHTPNDAATRDELLEATKTEYSGDVIVGEDLMIIDIADKISWNRAQAQ